LFPDQLVSSLSLDLRISVMANAAEAAPNEGAVARKGAEAQPALPGQRFMPIEKRLELETMFRERPATLNGTRATGKERAVETRLPHRL
jgi:hypothetical protein